MCVYFQDLFNLNSEMILRELNDLTGQLVGGNNINTLMYSAGDTVLIAESEGLQTLLDR